MTGENLFGIDVRGLDVGAFVASARGLFPWLACAWLLLCRRRHAAWLFAGVLAANVYVFVETNYPLQRLYGLGPSADRVSNLGLCQVVAAGHSPLRTAQVGQLHFEPFWGLLVATVSGWSPDRVLRIYPFFAAVMACGFACSLFAAGLSLRSPGISETKEDPWERALVAGFATLLCSVPLDFTGAYRVPWVMTFLLKPNHALGLVLIPLLLRLFATMRGSRRLLVGFCLHVLGWVFVLHMVYVALGLVLFAILAAVRRGTERKRDVLDVTIVLLVNLLIVSPYLYMLFVGYPFLVPNAAMTIPPGSPHLLEVTTRLGWVFILGIWGARVLIRRGDRLSRLWVTQLMAASLLWLGYWILDRYQLARERDEIFYWLRFLFAAVAGVGAWDLMRRAVSRLSIRLSPAAQAATLALVVLPFALPTWWDPVSMDPYFRGSLTPVEDLIRQPAEFLRRHTDPRAVVAGDHDFARWVAALGARRVLLSSNLHHPKDYDSRLRLERDLLRASEPEAVRAAAASYGVQYVVVTRRSLAEVSLKLSDLAQRPWLEIVQVWGDPSREFVALARVR